MKDFDRSKLYDGQKGAAQQEASTPSSDEKELMVLEARLEKSTGEDRLRIEELIRELTEKMAREGNTKK